MAATQSTTARSHDAILTLLNTYFEGLYRADSAMLATVFHPQLQYVSAVQKDFRVLTLPEYQRILDQREPPEARGELRQEEIVSIDVESHTLAFVKVRMTMLGRDYTDFLTLVFDQDHWAIIAKIFHYESANLGD